MTSSASPGEPRPAAADGSDDAEVWIPPFDDCMDHAHDPCPHCRSSIYHVRAGRCGSCGRRAVTELDEAYETVRWAVDNDEAPGLDVSLPLLLAGFVRLREQRDAVLALHFPDPNAIEPYGFCDSCRVMWPCPTAEAMGVSE